MVMNNIKIQQQVPVSVGPWPDTTNLLTGASWTKFCA